jgi:estrogen-related receptor beta like 1
MFTSLAAWLVRKIGRPFEQPQEYDDPNSTIAIVLDATRDLVSLECSAKIKNTLFNLK